MESIHLVYFMIFYIFASFQSAVPPPNAFAPPMNRMMPPPGKSYFV